MIISSTFVKIGGWAGRRLSRTPVSLRRSLKKVAKWLFCIAAVALMELFRQKFMCWFFNFLSIFFSYKNVFIYRCCALQNFCFELIFSVIAIAVVNTIY